MHDGLLYVPRVADEHHDHHTVPWCQLDVYDAETGQHLAKPKPIAEDALRPQALVLAGEHLVFASDSGGIGIRRPTPKVSILSLGERPKVLGQFELALNERIRGAPVVAGDSLLLRTSNELICLRRDDARGPRYQEEVLAQTVFRAIGQRPQTEDITVLSPAATLPDSVPIVPWDDRVVPGRWVATEPFAYSEDVDTIALLGGVPAIIAALDDAITFTGRKLPFTLLEAGRGIRSHGSVPIPMFGDVIYRGSYLLDMRALINEQAFRQVLLATVLDNHDNRVMRYAPRGQGVSAWINGHRINDGDLLRLPPGRYVLLLHATMGRIPPVGRPLFIPRFVDTPAPERAMAAWLRQVARYRDDLDRIIARLPGSGMALRAQDLLERLERGH